MSKNEKDELKMPEYSPEDYKKAITELDEEPEDDFFGRKTFTETGSSVTAVIKAIIYIVFVVSVSSALAYFAIVFVNDVFAFVKEDKEYEITIPEYVTADEIGDLLGDAGVVNYPEIFKLYAKLKKVDEKEVTYKFEAGTYTVNSNMNYDELLLSFVKSKVITTFRMTITEGLTVDEIIELFVDKGIGTTESWIDTINNYDFGDDFPFIDEIDMTSGRYYRLEGYLFPDTYEFYSNQDEAYYIRKLLNRFNDMFNSSLRQKCASSGITMDQALIIASIIEKEAYYPSNYGQVSSVIWNRLKNSAKYPKLECDSTIIYTLSHTSGTRVTELTLEDLELDDPFNSYVYPGFVPGPICNPSFNAIFYALNPDYVYEDTAETDRYYFFITDLDNYVVLAKTREEHNANVKQLNEEKELLKKKNEAAQQNQ